MATGAQRQAVNMRLLDADGTTVVGHAHRTTAAIIYCGLGTTTRDASVAECGLIMWIALWGEAEE